jgi:hypothetical protein
MTESPQKHRIHSVFSTSRRKFVIDFRPAEIGAEVSDHDHPVFDVIAVDGKKIKNAAKRLSAVGRCR